MTTTKKIKKSGLWQTIEVAGIAISQLAYLAVMARLLEKSDFGLMAIVGSLLAFGNVLSEAGMGAALIQKKKITNNHKVAALHGSLFLGVVFCILYLILAKPLSLFFDYNNMDAMIRVLSISILLNALSSVSISLLHKSFSFKQSSIVTVSANLFSYTVGVILAFNDYGVWSLVYAELVRSLFKALGYFYLAPIKWKSTLFKTEYKELFSFGSGMILLRFANYFGGNGINLLLGKIFAPELLGIFERAYKIKGIPSIYLGSVLDKVMFPVMSEIQDEKERLFKIYNMGLGVANVIMMPVATVLILFADEIVLVLLGKNWIDTVLPLQIMFVMLPFSISSRMADTVVRSLGYIYLNVKRKYTYVLILVTSVGLGGYYHGIVGAAVGYTFSYLMNYILMVFLVKRILNKTFSEIFIKPLSEAFMMTFIIGFIIVGFKLSFNLFNQTNVWLSSIFVLVLIGIVGILFFKYPSIYGNYIQSLRKVILKKKKHG